MGFRYRGSGALWGSGMGRSRSRHGGCWGVLGGAGGCRGVLGGAGVCMGEDLRRAPRRPGIYIYHVLSIAMCGFTLCSGGPCLSGWGEWVGTLE